MTETTFIIEGELTDLNSYVRSCRGHWAAAEKKVKENREAVYYSVLKHRQAIQDMKKPLDIHCHWVCKNRRKDKDNIRFGIKWILDGMEDAGAIENDGWKQIGNLSDSFSVDKNNPHIEVTVTESA